MKRRRARQDVRPQSATGFSTTQLVRPRAGTAPAHDQGCRGRHAQKAITRNPSAAHKGTKRASPDEVRVRWLRTQCATAVALAVSRAVLAVQAAATRV